jgi:hypothetical protein
VYLWGNQWHGKKILFHSDNQSVVEILNSCTSKSERVMTLVRHIILQNIPLFPFRGLIQTYPFTGKIKTTTFRNTPSTVCEKF